MFPKPPAITPRAGAAARPVCATSRAPLLDRAGFEAIDLVGGAVFDVAVRYLREDPWERMRILSSWVTETPLIVHHRGQSLFTFELFPDDVVELTVGYCGCFACIYSVRGAGGYQMFGITPMPIYDPKQEISYLREFMVFFRPGDIVKFRPVEREEYDRDVADVEAGRFTPLVREFTFSLDEFHGDIDGCNAKIGEVLHGN